MRPKVSVVIRAKDEAAAIGRTLRLLGEQEGFADAEVIVVDSGSSDRTREIAQEHGARLIEIAPESFSFGGALNAGSREAGSDVLVALSAHAYPPDSTWLARLVAGFDNPWVACACGQSHGPNGDPLIAPFLQDHDVARRYPGWGYSNAAGAFRAELWRQHQWREDMPGAEDKEWALHWLERGYVALIAPALCVDHDHSHDPLRDQYQRARREWEGIAMIVNDLPAYSSGDLLAEWWSERGSYRSRARALLSHRRAARLLGAYSGRRRARRG